MVASEGERSLLDHPKARAMAAGGLSTLEGARAVPSLQDALSGTVLVAGFTARLRTRLEPVPIAPRAAAMTLLQASLHGPVALVFGPEDRGLLNTDLDLCSLFVQIPANEKYPVYNLAASVVIAGYELAVAARSLVDEGPRVPDAPASVDEMERLMERFWSVFTDIRFLTNRARQGMVTLRGILGRAALQRREYRFLMGALGRILTAIDRPARKRR